MIANSSHGTHAIRTIIRETFSAPLDHSASDMIHHHLSSALLLLFLQVCLPPQR
jgi:hypothetical protein